MHISHALPPETLTLLPRREQFESQLEQWIQKHTTVPDQLAVLFLDLDGFKQINDTWGHQFGDQILQAVARRLQENIRPTDLLSRWGGDEFVIVLPNLTDIAVVQRLADRLLEVFEAPFRLEQTVYVGISIGISLFPDNGRSSKTLLHAADVALYHVKRSGKRQSQWFTPQLQQMLDQRLALSREVIKACAEKSFCLYFQPQIDLRTHRVSGYEVLLRWQHPSLGLLTPAEFLPLLQSLGLAAQLDDWVISEVLKRCASWRKLEPNLQFFVNVSSQRFLQKDFAESVKKALQNHHLPSHVLSLEISETANHISNATTIQSLAAYGIDVSLDDFGVGATNLALLQELGFKRLKIHRRFIQELEQPQIKILLKTMFFIAKQFGLEVVAQGVETETQLAWLKEQDCQFVQGFLLSEPMIAEAFMYSSRKNLTPS